MAFPYGDIVATTLDAWIEKGVAFDNIFKAHPLLEKEIEAINEQFNEQVNGQ